MKSSLTIPVQSIELSGFSLESEEEPETFPVIAGLINSGECRFSGPIQLTVKADRTQDLVIVTGTVKILIRLSCSRCLNDFEMSLSENFSLTYRHEIPQMNRVEESTEKELTADEFGLIYFHGEEIDIRELIQEQVVMMLPLRPLCSESCKGICPQCGTDLNQGECNCRKTVLDDRLAILKNFKVITDDD